MGGSKSKAPKAPNYEKLATQQAALDRDNDIFHMQNSGQSDMYGTSNWVQDANGNYTQQNTMSDSLKGQHTGASDLFSKYQQQLLNQGTFTGAPQVEWDPNSGNAAADAFYASGQSRLAPQQQEDAQRMQTQLRQQGLQPGTEAYDRAYKNLLTSQGDVNSKMALDAKVLGGQEARSNYQSALMGQQQNYNQDMQNYQLPWMQAQDAESMWNGLRTGPSGYAPSWSGQAADIAGAGQSQFNSAMAKSNASNQKKGNTMNAGAQLGSAALMSDATLKHDIVPLVGRDALEALLKLGGVKWRWNADNVEDMGVIAQEVQKVLPELINTDLSLLRVNYTGLVALAIESIKYVVENLPCGNNEM